MYNKTNKPPMHIGELTFDELDLFTLISESLSLSPGSAILMF